MRARNTFDSIYRFVDRWLSSALVGRYRYVARSGMALLGGSFLLLGASAYLDIAEQTFVAVFGIILFAIVNRSPSPRATLFLKFLSLLVSMRYVSWRLTETLDFQTWVQVVLGAC